MTPLRKRKIGLLVFFAIIIAIVASLVLYALRQNINLFYTPLQIARGEALVGHSIRVGGMVVPGSIVRSTSDLTVHFKITDYHKTLDVAYCGILPDLFREGQGIVALGHLVDQFHFEASTVLAKHDEKYMPPEVRDALKQNSGDVRT